MSAMRSYEAARTYFSFLAFLSWCVIILGVIVAIGALTALGQMSRSFGGSPMAGLAGLIPGIAITFLGFLGLVGVQIGRAGVDSAEYAQQGLKIAREQLEISRQALKQGSILEKGYAKLQAAKEGLQSEMIPSATAPATSYANAKPAGEAGAEITHQPGETIGYRGKTIRAVDAGYVFGGTIFATLDKAKARIDEDGFALPPQAETPKPDADHPGVSTDPKPGGVTRS